LFISFFSHASVFEHIFSQIEREQRRNEGSLRYLCKCSFLEIYNEKVFDLLVPDQIESGLQLRETISGGVNVEGLSEDVITNASEAVEK
jgi:kinesin family protein 15